MIVKIANIARQAMQPHGLRTMSEKAYRRVRDTDSRATQEENLDWLARNAVSLADIGSILIEEYWREAMEWSSRFNVAAAQVLEAVDVELGGGAAHPLLYYVARARNPNVILETGVAAGYSSAAFLAAIHQNGHGRLYSSDFPYFRLSNPEQYIGAVVDSKLHDRWTLRVEGDRVSLPRLVAKVDRVDIFHYDSDKTYAARKFAFGVVRPKLAQDALLLFDDIQDNPHFMDLVHELNAKCWHVMHYEEKYVGVIGDLASESTVESGRG